MPPKKKLSGWLSEHMPAVAADATATSAEQISRLMQPTGNTIGPAQRGNIPLPMPAPKETREGWIMSHLADVLPIVGEMRGVQAGYQTAKEGHPIIGGVLAAASVIPGVNRSVREMVQPFYSRVERAIAEAPFKKGTAEQWAAHLAKNSAAGEREWTGVAPFLAQNSGKVLTRDQVAAAHTPIQLGEKTLGGAPIATIGGDARTVHLPGFGDQHYLPHITFSNDADAHTFHREINRVTTPGEAQHFAGTYERAAQFYQRQNRNDEAQRMFSASEAFQTHAENLDLGRGGHPDQPKFAQYTEPGGSNYREKLITLGKKLGTGDTYVGPQGHRVEVLGEEGNSLHVRNLDTGEEASVSRQSAGNGSAFRSSHFDEPNILAHVRMKDRELPNGEKVLHLEELQSDWHQQGRSKGYAGPALTSQERARHDELMRALKFGDMTDALSENYGGDMGELDALRQKDMASRHVIPNAPFKKTEDWQLLGLKHAIHDAVHGGYDRVAWTPGDLQNDRYDLSKSVDKLTYYPNSGLLRAAQGSNLVHEGTYDPRALADVVGKDAADKLLAQPLTSFSDGPGYRAHVLEGDDLKAGGSGMRGFYDKMLPNNLKDYFKKIGVPAPQIEDAHFNVPSGSRTFPSFKITPELRNLVQTKGQPLWATVPFIGAGALAFGNDDPQKP